ncbi:metallophosphoesterase family protein [Flammeovirga kamogawensis]|uniref:Phosphoesterase n=1 Tax=Flammeovirga kamogawensis TaxID=373891 RepID=A0ABX8H3T4_9BACT|nr:metallophosphoesterase family protein [Flammeovirga kamogawensis]MBB6463499.1 putative phosphoesterase [Flammeovirga kamogawensis]QWG10558.1 metallophosphoesterase family protein [Flammeovirga kamogawensis]TRX63666.1 metallophosphoesterase family protein [Flammeovirga kamogawensis]
MKIAIFSDIHANLPAFEAFQEHIATQNVDKMYCLGDLVGYNIWPKEIIDFFIQNDIPCVLGNHDEAQRFPDIEGEHSNRSITKSYLKKEHLDYLLKLPREIKLEEKKAALLLVHGSTKAINDYLVEDYPEKEVIQMMHDNTADVLFCGHTHKPYHRIISSEGKFLHVINVGSIGKPKDGNPQGCYAILTINDTYKSDKSDSLQIDFKRFDYDVQKAADAVLESEFEDRFADLLFKAK